VTPDKLEAIDKRLLLALSTTPNYYQMTRDTEALRDEVDRLTAEKAPYPSILRERARILAAVEGLMRPGLTETEYAAGWNNAIAAVIVIVKGEK
jgi:hypothetical protein